MLAFQVGFDACGISKTDYLQDQVVHLNHWLDSGYHGEMGYMERNTEKRLDPRVLVQNAKSVISVLLNYYPGNPDISTKPPKISRYALSLDYHVVVKDKLYQLLGLIRKEFGNVEGRAFVDSAPVLEKSWAVRAGLGWIGKNSLLINPSLGSYVFIGELIVDLEIETNTTQTPNRCGTCTRCIDACPTGAIVSPSVIDSRKCISYLTIEKKTPLTEEEQNSLNGWCFGCDICQEVCPWNGKAINTNCDDLLPKQEILNLVPSELKSISNEKFDTVFSDTPLSRAEYKRIILNSNDHK
ncbi:MAG: tRNA epoxyqueuosine(34) reductase QueG [Bacteroidales bacterium]|nr:MAG: tRNA epoxyqueuosine(34) reductase QueG [Bacteroidales bacterium]